MTVSSPELREAAERYIELETRVNEAVTAACQPVCRVCADYCCAVRFCRESVESPWLRTIATVSGHGVGAFDEKEGWLTPQGCRLTVGRPPVCYEFFCEAINRGETNPYRRYSLNVLGRLVGFAGARVLGGRHLVTLSPFELQNRLRLEKFQKRLETAAEISRYCQEILRTGDGRLDRLKLVLAPPKEIVPNRLIRLL
jgi:hypothetical protein